MERLSVRVVGAFAVDGLDPRELGSRKARTLFKILACERGGAVSSDRIAEALWRDELPAKPSDQVSVLVSRLRSVLGVGRIPRSDAGYALRYDWLDLDELLERSREAVARLDAGQFGAARSASSSVLRLVNGRAFGEEDALWADRVRDEIERAVIGALRAGARASLEVGAFSDAIALGTDVLVRDPFDEPALRVVMRGHSLLGRPGTALATYAVFRERLVDEFGIGPSTATEQVHDEIVLGVGEDPARWTEGDSAEDVIVGREAELAFLDGCFAAAHASSQLVVVEGEPGIGKSELVAVWGRGVARRGAHVVVARCDQPGWSLPLQPLLDAVNEWLVRVLGAEPADILVRDDPVLGGVLGFRGAVRTLDADEAITSVEEPELGRRRLFDALSALVDAVRGDRPIVMIVDDAHLADAATLDWAARYVRSADRALVVMTSRDHLVALGPATTLELGPLGLASAVQLVGDRVAAAVYERSAGNPLFLLELARVPDGELPDSIVTAVRRRSTALGPAASTVRVAALLGLSIDLDLLAACCRRPVAEVLDHIAIAVDQHVVIDDAAGLRFRHEVVREALVAGTTGSVRAFVHREASTHLAARADRSPLDAAHHAERGGTAEIAAAAFVEGAQIAMNRFEAAVAEELLDRAIALVDSPSARVERARVRLARRHLEAAETDVAAALQGERAAGSLELAGWIAYYRRDYRSARDYALEAMAQPGSVSVRAGAATLDGRIKHSRGDLVGALTALQSAVDLSSGHGVTGSSGVARVWLSSVLTHQGRVVDALHTLDRIGDPSSLRAHPYATAHAMFTRCLAAGISGDLSGAFLAAEALHHHAHNTGAPGFRFRALALNMRGWLERSVGNLDQADDLSEQALRAADGAEFDEPTAHARLDQVEVLLIRGRTEAASGVLDDIASRLVPSSTMVWHQRQRVMLLAGRLALLIGDTDRAVEQGDALLADARARSSERYAVLARHVRLVAAAAMGMPVDIAEVDDVVSAIDRVAALDSWRLIADLAGASGVASLWPQAEARAGALCTQAHDVAHLVPATVAGWTSASIDHLRHRWSR